MAAPRRLSRDNSASTYIPFTAASGGVSLIQSSSSALSAANCGPVDSETSGAMISETTSVIAGGREWSFGYTLQHLRPVRTHVAIWPEYAARAKRRSAVSKTNPERD